MPELRSLMLEGYEAAPNEARRLSLQTEEKSSFSDIVTYYDKAVEKWVQEKLKELFPNDIVLGEESTAAAEKPIDKLCQDLNACWIIDPIDGTTNFSRSYPFFCSNWSFVEKIDGQWQCTLGLTFDPVKNECFYSRLGGGAWLNGEQLKVSQVSTASEALLTTGFASLRKNKNADPFQLFAQLTQETLGVRRDGSAALDLAYVAAGRIDAYWEGGLSIWDIAAGTLLVQEAGGQITRRDGSSVDLFDGEIVSSNQGLHKWLLHKIKGSQ
jgi:myo-inositol-1(or 4)-monophosphatase